MSIFIRQNLIRRSFKQKVLSCNHFCTSSRCEYGLLFYGNMCKQQNKNVVAQEALDWKSFVENLISISDKKVLAAR